MKNKQYLLTILASLVLLTFLSKILLKTDELLVNSLTEQFTQEQLINILNFQKKWEWFTYVIILISLLIKILIITSILDLGCFLFNKKIKYKELFNIVVKAEFIFILVIIVKTAWFYFFQTNYTLEDLQFFYPLSALSLIGHEGLQPWFVYPFQVLNLFELAYWFILAFLLGKELKSTTDKGLSIVASSYGVGLLIWVVGVMFSTLNMS